MLSSLNPSDDLLQISTSAYQNLIFEKNNFFHIFFKLLRFFRLINGKSISYDPK